MAASLIDGEVRLPSLYFIAEKLCLFCFSRSVPSVLSPPSSPPSLPRPVRRLSGSRSKFSHSAWTKNVTSFLSLLPISSYVGLVTIPLLRAWQDATPSGRASTGRERDTTRFRRGSFQRIRFGAVGLLMRLQAGVELTWLRLRFEHLRQRLKRWRTSKLAEAGGAAAG